MVDDGGIADPGFWPCVRQLRRQFPHIKIGAAGGGPDDQFVWVSQHPKLFGKSVAAWVESHKGLIDELWTDFEPKWQTTGLIGPNETDLSLPACTASAHTVRLRFNGFGPPFLDRFATVSDRFGGLVPVSGILGVRWRKWRKNGKKRGKNGREMA